MIAERESGLSSVSSSTLPAVLQSSDKGSVAARDGPRLVVGLAG